MCIIVKMVELWIIQNDRGADFLYQSLIAVFNFSLACCITERGEAIFILANTDSSLPYCRPMFMLVMLFFKPSGEAQLQNGRFVLVAVNSLVGCFFKASLTPEGTLKSVSATQKGNTSVLPKKLFR